MFYLLADNTIIDSENLPKNVKIERIAKDDKDNAFFIQIQYLDFLKTRKIGYIKKQSENVFDLIEVGDLIARYRYSIEGRTNKKEINSVDELYEDENGVGINQCCIVDYDDICAIYKPNANGDYIKVWEKKEGEQ